MALDRIRVRGGKVLRGEIEVGGAKNAALPMMAAALLTKESCRLRRTPLLHDVLTMAEILRVIGTDVRMEGRETHLQAKQLSGNEAPYDFVRKMRASVLLLGPLVSRFGFARVSMPGGCAIGLRPIDLHLKALKAMGAELTLSDGYVEAKAGRLKGVKHVFDQVTVTGTINAVMAATLADGSSIFQNCACEPEVTAMMDLLKSMGAKISGEGTSEIRVEGQTSLGGFDVDLIPDRIEAGTYLVAGAITQGDLFLRGAQASHLEAVLSKLRETGAEIKEDAEGIRVIGRSPILPTQIQTAPFPGFPTDMQAQFVSLLSLAEGTSTVTETIFDNRFMHVAELQRMGADLRVSGSTVTIAGVKQLAGAPVMATDLRASASLVIAGLAAHGTTEVLRIYHLDRGYESMETKLAGVGADIVRLKEHS